jgi:hypothetical protein
LALVLKGVAMLAAAAWFFVFAYADWLRFSSPTTPNAATGQVIHEKAVKGVFYITNAQAWMVQYDLLPIWLTMFGAILGANWADAKAEPVGASAIMLWRVVGAAWVVTMLSLFLFGDQVMSLLFTGSLTR